LITHFIDLMGRQVGGFRSDFCAAPWRRLASGQSYIDQRRMASDRLLVPLRLDHSFIRVTISRTIERQ